MAANALANTVGRMIGLASEGRRIATLPRKLISNKKLKRILDADN